MSRYALVENDYKKVVNVIVWEGKEWLPPRNHLVIPSDDAAIGDMYDEASNSFKRPESALKPQEDVI